MSEAAVLISQNFPLTVLQIFFIRMNTKKKVDDDGASGVLLDWFT